MGNLLQKKPTYLDIHFSKDKTSPYIEMKSDTEIEVSAAGDNVAQGTTLISADIFKGTV